MQLTAARGAGHPLGAAARAAWPLAVAAVALAALGLRLWGIGHGLPYVYNVDEGAHFVPRAIGFFDHSLDPGYFINPPGLTYLLHGLFWIRWGGDGVQATLATDPSAVWTAARALTAVLGAVGVALLALAVARLRDRRTALAAAALLAVAFLPVHYAHFALNDVPALAPLCLSLLAAAMVLRGGGTRWHVLAGAALGVACAVKYTSAVGLVAYAAAALPAPRRRLAAGLASAAGGFLLANPYAALDPGAVLAGLREQSAAAGGGGKLGLPDQSGIAYYLETLTWGLGWIPALAAVAGALVLARRDRRLLAVLAPAPLLCLLALGLQERFFARWLLPAYPFLCALAAIGALAALDALARGRRRAEVAVAAAALLGAQGLVHAVHNDRVLARDDTRALAREWLAANVPAGSKVVIEPVVPDPWATDVGRLSPATGNGARWRKWPTSRSRGRVVRLEDYERTLRPALVRAYARGGYCWVLTGSTQSGRAYADPQEVPDALRYYAELRRVGEVVHRVRPWRTGAAPLPFSFDFSYNAYPLGVARPGPEIVIHRLRGGGCR